MPVSLSAPHLMPTFKKIGELLNASAWVATGHRDGGGRHTSGVTVKYL